MSMEEKNQHIIEYINNVEKSVNESIPNFIDDDKIKRAIEMFSNRDEDMYAGTFDDGKSIDKISSLNNKNENTTKLQATRGPEIKSFGWKSPSEKQKYQLKMQKNQIMAMNNPKYQQSYQNQQSLQNKPKVKTLTQNASNKGFTNVITLSLITSFVAGALFMLMYFIVR